MHFKKERILIDSIDLDDKLYRITTEKNDVTLLNSINSLGLLHPPFLIRKKAYFQIISGFRRILALKSAGVTEVNAMIIKDSNDKLSITKLAISENSLQRPLNIVEKARSLNLLSKCIHNMDALSDAATSVGVPCDNELAAKLITISQLNDSIHQGLIDGYISMPVSLMLDNYDRQTSDLFVESFKNLRLSLNRQREFILLITEIAQRDNIEPAQLMKESFFSKVLKDENLDRSQKIQLLLKMLKRIRFPYISKAEECFVENTKNLDIKKGIQLIPPKDFESVIYTLQLTFKSLTELNSIKKRLDRIIKDPKFEEILDR